jgi:hypothetical protein
MKTLYLDQKQEKKKKEAEFRGEKDMMMSRGEKNKNA